MITIKDKIAKHEAELGFIKLTNCAGDDYAELKKLYDENSDLPPDVIADDAEEGFLSFYKVSSPETISDEDKIKYLKYLQANNLNKIKKDIHTIKNCVVFFTVMTVISLCIGFLAIFINL